MIKLALVESVSRQYLHMQKTMRRNKKLMSSGKLITVLVIFFSVLAIYATNITSASTKGYFHRQETKKNDTLTFDRSIIDLDILKLEQKLLNEVQNNSSTWYRSQDRVEIVTTYNDDLVIADRATQ